MSGYSAENPEHKIYVHQMINDCNGVDSSSLARSFLLQHLRQAEKIDEKKFASTSGSVKAGDTVPGSMSKLRGNPTSIKIDLINKRSVDQFQRLN